MKHFEGGTLKKVMAMEVKRVLKKHRRGSRPIIAASLELGIHQKTLREWLKPVEQGGWEELQPTNQDIAEVLKEIFGGD